MVPPLSFKELTPKCVVNLGVGVPEEVAHIANEEGLLESLTLTAEPGGGPSCRLLAIREYSAIQVVTQLKLAHWGYCGIIQLLLPS